MEQIEAARMAERERLRAHVRRHLARTLHELIPHQAVIVFGSIVQMGRFHKYSDIDIALLEEPPHHSIYRLQVQLEERMQRPVDLVLLPESRLRGKIEATGEKWMN